MKPDENSLSSTKAQVKRITWIGLYGNLLLAVVKFVLGIIGSSRAVVADAVHSLSDMTTDLAILFGIKYWTAPADDCHPYGHQRIETMMTAGIGLVLVIVAVGIGYDAVITLNGDEIAQPGWIAFWAAVFSIAVKETLYRWTVRVGKRTRSSVLIANAWHHRSDAFSSVPAAVAVGLTRINPAWAYVDRIGAIVISLFIFHAAWKIIKPAFFELSDGSAPKRLSRRIYEIALDVAKVESAHAIRTRRMGDGYMADLHITVDGDMTVSKGHDVSEAVKERIRGHMEEILDVVVHLEPEKKKGPKV